MRISTLYAAPIAAALAGCTTTGATPTGQNQVIADARNLLTVSYQCQDALGKEPHYSAIESSETVLRGLGKSAQDADQTVRGWLREVVAGPNQPGDLDARICKDRLLTLAEKVRRGYESLKRGQN